MDLHPADPLNIISLCTGGGGLDIGVELAIPSARPVVAVEGEAFACARLVSAMQQGLMAPAPLWSDVTTFRGRPWRGLVDGVIGGIPCQPHSLAGKRLGEDDERDLWSDARRIIVQSGAWWVLIENVGGMLSAPAGLDPGAKRVWRDLQRMGFEVEGGVFLAEEVGSPQGRERIFILGVMADAENSYGWRREWRTQEGVGPGELGGRRPSVGGARVPLGVGQADPTSQGSQGGRPDGHRPGERPAIERGGGALEYPEGERCGEGRPEPSLRPGRRPTASGAGGPMDDPEGIGRALHAGSRPERGGTSDAGGAGATMGDALGGRGDGRSDEPERGPEGRAASRRPGGGAFGPMADADLAQLRGVSPTGEQPLLQQDDGFSVWPPGPGDLDGWRRLLADRPEVEPAICGNADGMAARVDQLRLLGNGVVPLQAAYAIRTLATDLARRSAGAARLVRMMEGGGC